MLLACHLCGIQCFGIHCAAADDWPWFLGPRHDGTCVEADLKLNWNEQAPAVLWKKRIGTGYSAPSIVGNQVILHDGPNRQERITSFNAADGEVNWKQTFACEYQDRYQYNNGPRCSPVIVDGQCFTLGPDGRLCCLALDDGHVIWQKKLAEEFDLPDSFFGAGCSPIYHDGLLLVLVGGQPNSGVVAFEASSGKLVWENVGKNTWDGSPTDRPGKSYQWTGDEMVVSYSSPIVATFHGQPHLLCLVRQGLVSLNPKTGEENFHYWFRAKVHESVNAARPVVIGNQIFLSAAYRLGSAMLEVASDGKSVQTIWKNNRLEAHWSTPIHVEGYLYGFSGRHRSEGELRCVQASDGKLMWSTTGMEQDASRLARDPQTGKILDRASGKPVPYPYFGRGSLTRAGDHFLILGESGTLAIAKVSSSHYEEVHRVSFPEISDPAWTAPVISNGHLYLRSEDWLLCLDLKK